MSSRSRLFLLLAAWLAAAFVAGSFHLFAHLPPVAVQVTIALLTVSFSLALTRGRLRAAAASFAVKSIVALHVLRFVGFWFLWLHAQGRMPAEFAERAGVGDIIAAAWALALLFWPEGPGFRRSFLFWNIVGVADLFLAVGTAGWLNATRPGAMVELSQLPLTLVPLFAVPVLIASHFHLLGRMRREVPAPARPAAI